MVTSKDREIMMLASNIATHDVSRSAGILQAIKDRKITVFDSRMATGPFAGRVGRRHFIGEVPMLFDETRRRALAHEFGHILLGHLLQPRHGQEGEAERFAQAVCGPETFLTRLKLNLTVSWLVVRRPRRTFIAEFDQRVYEEEREAELIQFAESRSH